MAARGVRRAWFAVAGVPVAYVAATLIGEGLLTLQGYPSGADPSPPLDAVLLAALPALVVLTAPGALAAWWGLRSADRRGRVPGALGAALAVLAVTLNVLALLVGG